jgi:hypothetical protein
VKGTIIHLFILILYVIEARGQLEVKYSISGLLYVLYSEAGCPIDLRLAKFNIPSAPSVSTNIHGGDSFC